MAIPPSIQSALDAPYTLTQEHINFFQQNRFIKLKQVLDPETVDFFNEVISEQVHKMNKVSTSLEERAPMEKLFYSYLIYGEKMKT